ncbi:copper chaperone PCu(A)C [Streptomyces sp. NPDC002187]|uniref:copper chaperone PCu(A)C n=1 Tax=Streptomyces sp. NPDC002187 TaxID=3364637 RepID=UPI0036A3FD33
MMARHGTERTATDRPPALERLWDGLLAGLAPVTACVLALAGLTTWTALGAAGTPPRVQVEDARILMPSTGRGDTAVFFRISNSGGSADQLLSVTSPLADKAVLTRHVGSGGGDSANVVTSTGIPAGGTLVMSSNSLEVAVTLRSGLHRRPGESVPFTLRFRHSGAVDTAVVVVRPGS